MPTIVVPASVTICQVDDFPTVVILDEKAAKGEKAAKVKTREFERTPRGKRKIKGGALHVRPASSLEVTDDELAHLEAKHKKLLSLCIVHRPKKPNPKTAVKPKVKTEAEAQAEAAEKKTAADAEAAEKKPRGGSRGGK